VTFASIHFLQNYQFTHQAICVALNVPLNVIAHSLYCEFQDSTIVSINHHTLLNTKHDLEH